MNKNYAGLILGVIGLLLIVFGYMYIWNNIGEKTDALNVENAALDEEVTHLKDLADHKEQYLADTEAMKQENDEIIAQFPADVKNEDEILYADQTEKSYLASITAIAMPGSNVIEVAQPEPEATEESEEVTEEATAEEGEVVEDTATEAAPSTPSIMLYQTPVTVTINSTYSQMKEIVDAITADKSNKKSIDMLTMNFDEDTGDLTGAISYSMYSLSGTDKTYTSPSLPGVGTGTDDLFNTAERKQKIAAENAKAAAQAAASAAERAAAVAGN
ncbi:MAG: hypothetical protein K5739_09195 [Lachnospiraceae bacterium]|nr:hypothetical protein [Lachnospiraceae bacterium]